MVIRRGGVISMVTSYILTQILCNGNLLLQQLVLQSSSLLELSQPVTMQGPYNVLIASLLYQH